MALLKCRSSLVPRGKAHARKIPKKLQRCSMPRIRRIEMDGFTLAVSPLSYDEAQAHVTKTRELLEAKDPETTAEQWVDRTIETVAFALNRAAGTGSTNG